ncbi:MAG: NAD-dependent epimerase/dehydratase family protein, partial [Planctomycetota bacterium]
ERDEDVANLVNARLVESICRDVAAVRDPGWAGQDVVHVGSAFEYGLIAGDLAEDSEPRPATTYGRSKLGGTLALKRAAESGAVAGLTARLFTVYGPGEHGGRLLPSLLEASRTGVPLDLTAGLQRRDFTYVEDVAEGLLRLGARPAVRGDVVNLATGRLSSVREFVLIAADALGIPVENLRFGDVPTRSNEMEHDDVAVDRMRDLASWIPPTGIEEGVRRTAEFANHGLRGDES